MLTPNPFLLEAAFEAIPTDSELELKLSSLYGEGIERVSEYSADRSSDFWTQMEELEGFYLSMVTDESLILMLAEFFRKLKANEYVDTSPESNNRLFYQNIKATLETILILMRDKSATDQKKIIQGIVRASSVCGPGLFTNLQEIAASLRKMEGLCFWLAESRKNLLTRLAEEYITDHGIEEGISVHVHFAFYKIANEAGLSIPGSEAYTGVSDTFARLLSASYEEMKNWFLIAFERDYSRAYILETLIARFREALGSFERIEALSTEQSQNVIRILKPFTEGEPPVFNLRDALEDGEGEEEKEKEEEDDDASLSSSWKIKTDFFKNLPGYCKALAIKQGILADLDADGFEKIPASRLDGIDIFGISLDKIDWTAAEPQPVFFASIEQILALSRREEIHLDFSRIHLSGRENPHPKLDGEQVKLLYSKGFRNFRGYDLSSADLRGIYLTDANLSGVIIHGARLDRSAFLAFYQAGIKDFTACNLFGADLTGASFYDADLRGADLSDANLADVDFSGANLFGAIIRGARLDRLAFTALYRTGIRDFRYCNLSSINLTIAHLYGADLSGANLSGADLSRADLSVTNLSGTDLTGADLYGTIISGANLTDAKLTGTSIRYAQLDRSAFDAFYQAGIRDFLGCDLTGASFYGADLRDTDLRDTNLRGTDLSDVDFSGANLFGAIIRGAQLDRSAFLAFYQAGIRDFRGCNLSGANLSSTNLTGTHLFGADLSGTNLSGADLRGTDLSGADLSGAHFFCADFTPLLYRLRLHQDDDEQAKRAILDIDTHQNVIDFLNSLHPPTAKRQDLIVNRKKVLLAIQMIANQRPLSEENTTALRAIQEWVNSPGCFLKFHSSLCRSIFSGPKTSRCQEAEGIIAAALAIRSAAAVAEGEGEAPAVAPMGG